MAPTDNAEEIAKAERKLQDCQQQLDQLEALKTLEPNLRKDVAKLTAKISELRKAAEDEEREHEFFNQPAMAPLAERIAEAKVEQERDPAAERLKKLKSFNKKLKQIEQLKANGGELDKDAAAKVASEADLRNKVAALERGEDVDEGEEEGGNVTAPSDRQNGDTDALPTDPAAVEKRVRTLKKKLQDIERLKQKGGHMDEEAVAKVDSEQRFLQELAALEAGKSVFVYDEAAALTAKKIDKERQLKKARKKLKEIESLKAKGEDLDSAAQAKVASEAELKKETHQLEMQIGAMNKQERGRVAERLGWENEEQDNVSKKSKGKKKS